MWRMPAAAGASGSPSAGPGATGGLPDPTRRARLRRVVELATAVADTDPERIDSLARQLGSSRSYLAPVAWTAGTVVLLLRGVKLLLLNWRLTLIQLVPAVVVWLAMYDLRVHALHRTEFRHLGIGWVVAGFVVTVLLSIVSFWCNTVFAFAIDTLPPRIGPAIARARERWRPIVAAGVVMGLVLGAATLLVPRLGRLLLFDAVLLGVIGLMVVAFVAVPARILERRTRKLPPKEAIGRTLVGWALSIVAMTPGFLLDRTGILLMGVPGLWFIGFVVLSIGTALYAAGMSSVKAVKLSIKLAEDSEDSEDVGQVGPVVAAPDRPAVPDSSPVDDASQGP